MRGFLYWFFGDGAEVERDPVAVLVHRMVETRTTGGTSRLDIGYGRAYHTNHGSSDTGAGGAGHGWPRHRRRGSAVEGIPRR